MPRPDQHQLRGYVARIARSEGGLEGLVERVRTIEEILVPEGTEAPAVAAAAGAGLKAVASDELAAAARSAVEKLAQGNRDLSRLEMFATEAIIIPDKRPAFEIVNGDFVADHELWRDLTGDANIHGQLRKAIPAVGRIELPGQTQIPYGGTGFVVGHGLLMTNRHVAEIFASGLGDRRISFRSGWRAAVDFKAEYDQPDGPDFEVRAVRMIHPWWDMALLEVPDLPATIAPLRMAVRDARDLARTRIAVIGYPARDPLRNDPAVQDKLFDRVFRVKRLQPGEIAGGKATSSFGHMVQAATHDCSTLGGNSGSAIIDLATGEVLGLHFGGRYLDTNYAVPAIELARDARVVDAGVKLAGAIPSGPAPAWLGAWRTLDIEDETADRRGAERGAASGAMAGNVAGAGSGERPTLQLGSGRVTFEIPLRVTIELGNTTAIGANANDTVSHASETVAEETTERMVAPTHDTDYRSRNGYDPGFLGHIQVPIPKPRNPSVLARTKTGGTTLDYQNFSLMMHAERRLALVTAWNITRDAKLRRPEPGRDYSRKGLGGLNKNDTEMWFEDSRLDSRFQLPDVFFTKDGGTFDKGHLVRREDVAWGRDYASVVRANGDTFHVTNCSPQVALFNQSIRGEDNWGDLENLVLTEAAQERLCLFGGPVLDQADQTFVGVVAGGLTLRVRIPSRFWKVVVAATAEEIAAYGFVLEQDLSAVELEFTVSGNFRRLQVPLSEIEDVAGIDFGDILREADAWGSEAAEEMATRAGLVRTEALARAEPEAPTPNVGDDEDAEANGDRTARSNDTETRSSWRVAKALLALRRQVDARSPQRNKASDGAIGDAAHATRDSDHNPWVRDGGMGVVTAMDITHDPAGGCDAGNLVKAIVASQDRRVKYVIWNRQIANAAAIGGSPAWTWRPYRGANPHDHHVHISVKAEKADYDDESAWQI